MKNKKNILQALLRTVFLFVVIVFVVIGVYGSETVHAFTTYQPASNVLGQTDYIDVENPAPIYDWVNSNGYPNRFSFYSISDVAIDTLRHKLYVGSNLVSQSPRILVYDLDVSNNPIDLIADAVIGQSGYATSSSASLIASTTLGNSPTLAIDIAGGRLFVGEATNSRILVYDISTPVDTFSEPAVNVLGQADMVTGTFNSFPTSSQFTPTKITFDPTTNRLYVASFNVNRVMVFDVSTITNGEPAINVLGQPDFSTYTSGITASKLNTPRGMVIDSSSQKLYVSDTSNNRVLVFDVATITDGESAINVLGQTNFTTNTSGISQSKLTTPIPVTISTTTQRLFVGENGNNRVLVFDVATITDGENAINVIGQPNFTTSGLSVNQRTVANPAGLTVDENTQTLYVGDNNAYRVMFFNVATTTLIANNSTTDYPLATNLIGQYDDSDRSNFVPDYNKFTQTGTPHSYMIQSTRGMDIDTDNHRLFLSDSSRLLMFELDSSNNLINNLPDRVLGQVSFGTTSVNSISATSTKSNNGVAYDKNHNRVFVADVTNERILVFDTTSITNGESAVNVLGQTDFVTATNGTSSSKMNLDTDTDLEYDSDTDLLYVTDTTNNRVLVFDVATITNGEPAIHVLGQTDFVTSSNGLSANKFSLPKALAIDRNTNRLFVGDNLNNRVLVFDVATITDGENAVNVIGQPDFITNSSGVTSQKLFRPLGLAYHHYYDELYVADNANRRVLVYNADTVSLTPNDTAEDFPVATTVLGQTDFVSNLNVTNQNSVLAASKITIDETNNTLYVGGTFRVTVFSSPVTLQVELSTSTSSTVEGVAISSINVHATGTLLSAATVELVDTLSGTAASGTDYTVSSPYVVTIPAGTYDGVSPGSIFSIPNSFATIDDATLETNETVMFSLTNFSTSNVGVGDADGGGTILTNYTHTIVDNDSSATTTVGVVATDSSAAEPNNDGVFTFELSAATNTPTTVTYTIGGSATNGTDYATLSGNIIIAANATTSTVVLDVIDDSVAESSENAALTITGISNVLMEIKTASTTATTTITDNDVAGITIVSVGDNTTTEAGGTAYFNIALTSQPTANVIIPLTSSNLLECTVPASITITPTNWSSSTANTVTVTGVDDVFDDGDTNCVISTGDVTSVDTIYAALDSTLTVTDDVTITNIDDEAPGIVVTALDTTTSESGDTAIIQFELLSMPVADVTINLSISDGTEGTLSGTTSITITPANWNIPANNQVIVTGVDDGIIDGNIIYSFVTGSAVSIDAGYSIAAGSITDITLNNTDNDIPGVSITGTPLSVSETGPTSDIFSAVLNVMPAADVDVQVIVTDAQSTVNAASMTTITFTTLNWNVPVDVTVQAIDDTIDEANTHTGSISFVASSTDSNYNGLVIADITVSITDNDTTSTGGGGGGGGGRRKTTTGGSCNDSRAINYSASSTTSSGCMYLPGNIPGSVVAPNTGAIAPVENQLSCATTPYLVNYVSFNAINNPQDVMMLERYLNTYEKANLPVDGIYGAADVVAVKQWQEKYASEILAPWGLTQGTGYVYITSLRKIKQVHELNCGKLVIDTDIQPIGSSCLIFNGNLQFDDNNNRVLKLQQALGELGFFPVSIIKNGNYGVTTKNAILQFQKTHNIDQTGIYGPITGKKIESLTCKVE